MSELRRWVIAADCGTPSIQPGPRIQFLASPSVPSSLMPALVSGGDSGYVVGQRSTVMPRIPPSVSLRDLARHVGVSAMTVSRALRGLPQVGEALRQRILAAATELGYVPDPALAVLNTYRHRGRTAKIPSRLAYLMAGPTLDLSHATIRRSDYAAISAAATRLGYLVEEVEVERQPAAERAVGERLAAQGVKGLVLESCPSSWQEAALDWSPFALAAIFSGLDQVRFPYVDSNHFATCDEVARQLRQRGYRRPGIAAPMGNHLLSYRAQVAAARALLGVDGGFEALAPLLVEGSDWNAERWSRWLDQAQPDVVVSLAIESASNWILATGRRVPQDVGFCSLDVQNIAGSAAGMYQRRDHLAGLAVDLLHHQLVSGQRGSASEPLCLSLPGLWVEGRTLRPVPPH